MAKKSKQPSSNHLQSRVSFLYQAATYLAHTQWQPKLKEGNDQHLCQQSDESGPTPLQKVPLGTSNRLLSHLRGVSRKGQVKISPDIKRTVCKRCDALLVPGHTMTKYVENRSQGREKPWADVLVRRCKICGCGKRYPVVASRQPKKASRKRVGEAHSGRGADHHAQNCNESRSPAEG